MTTPTNLNLGYDLKIWNGCGKAVPILTDISPKTNSHTLITGMSGSGKSYYESLFLARLSNTEGIVYFADYKQDDSFTFLKDCPRYYAYNESLNALDIVYEILHQRQSGDDTSREPITFIWDEYIANVLAIQSIDKKKSDEVMRKVSEILMLGRSLGVRLVVSCQRPDASAFPSGSRLNYGIILILGAPIKSIYDMLIPKEYYDRIEGENFKTGEGVVLLQGYDMRLIKTPRIHNFDKLQMDCIDALTREQTVRASAKP